MSSIEATEDQVPIVVRELAALRAQCEVWRSEELRIAFVPTMGNLHEGHFSLVDRARELADRVIASIFVNPTQFGPNEDLDSYPRTFDADREGLARHGCDLIYAPTSKTMYPGGTKNTTRVSPPAKLVNRLCGRSRPGHFDGVATVVVSLFNQVQPDVAVFGQKDYQQLLVIRAVASDLSIPVEIVGAPTVREASGLAMSSRNGYLSATERRQAAAIHHTLSMIARGLRKGQHPSELQDRGMLDLKNAGLAPEYIEILNADTLGEPESGQAVIVLAAARVGPARLIDNIFVEKLP